MLFGFLKCFSNLPEYVVLFLCPVLLLIAGAFCAAFKRRGVFRFAAGILLGVQVFLLCCFYKSAYPVGAYLGLFLILYVLTERVLPLFFRKRKGESAEEMYERFHLSLEQEEPHEQVEVHYTGQDGVRLTHALGLIEKLKESRLSPGDRLELDAVSRTLEALRGRILTGEEAETVNDGLACVLKLTAKYKL